MLRPFHHFAVDSKQIGTFQSFETKIGVTEVPVIDDGGVKNL
jgi:hypothetical protein